MSMTQPVRASKTFLYLGAAFIFIVSLAIRLKPFFFADHFFSVPIDFDEGVYFAASLLIKKGLLPYRDFDFAHPPAIAWLFALFNSVLSTASVASSFAQAKVTMCVLGSLSALMIWHIFTRFSALVSGIIASLLYLSYPEAIVADRGIFLEPLVNFCALLALLMVVQPLIIERENESEDWTTWHSWRWMAAGLIMALALSVKLTAAVWLPGFFFLAPKQSRFPALAYAVTGGVVGLLLFMVPWVLLDPHKFFDGVIDFQLTRLPDGDIYVAQRIASIFRDQHLTINLLSGLAICGYRTIPKHRKPFFLAVVTTTALTLLLLLKAKAYWSSYNTQLAVPLSLLAGFVVYPLDLFIQRIPSFRWPIFVILSSLILLDLRSGFKGGRARAPEQVVVAEKIQSLIPRDSCLFVFEPGLAIIADRFPPVCEAQQVLIDPYLVMLQDARLSQKKVSSPSEAFGLESAQTRIRPQMLGADYVVIDPRARGQLNAASQAMLSGSFRLLGETTTVQLLARKVD